MRSRRVTLRVPWRLYDELEKIAQEDGFNDISAMMIGACVILIQNHRRKKWVPAIANAKPNRQDLFVEKMLEFPTDADAMERELRRMG